METDKLRRPRVEPRARPMNIRRHTSQTSHTSLTSQISHTSLTRQITQLMRAAVVHIRATAITAAIVSVAGCVGPAYVKPKVDAPSAFKESSPAAYTGADPGAWQPAQPQDAALKGKWWEVFGEPELNTLEDQLNINNQNIAQFFQNFMAARAQVSIARAS